MKPHIQKLPLSEQSSFVADTFVTPYFETPWHYHQEYELTLIIRGNGKRLVGNHVSNYGEGDLDFLGPNLPHWYRKEDAEEQGGSLVIHFTEEFLGQGFLQIPEMQRVLLLFERSKMGLHITGDTRQLVAEKMYRLLNLSGMPRLMCLLSILECLSGSAEYTMLSSPSMDKLNTRENNRLQKVFGYVMDNFKNEINIDDVARIALMSPSGFCRYFKSATKKTFSQFVNEIRVGHACKQLMNRNYNVSYVCYESGFNNMANFNKQFKKIVNETPLRFRQKHKL